jgi:NADH-quinone oxidoreductase subunit H
MKIAMGLAIVALVMKSGTLSLGEIVTQQQGDWINALYQPLGFLIFSDLRFCRNK